MEIGKISSGPAGLNAAKLNHGLAENIAKYPRALKWQGRGPEGGPYTWWPATYATDEQEMARQIVKGWMGSEGHRANILNSNYVRLGVGVAVETKSKYGYIDEVFYATQNFSSCR